jgi:hypothetical protein
VLGLVLAGTVGAGSVVSTWRGYAGTRRARPAALRELVAALRASDGPGTAVSLSSLLGDDGAIVAEAIVHGAEPARGVAALNDHLAAVESALTRYRAWLGASPRVAFSGGALGGVVELSKAVSVHAGQGYVLAAAAFGVGCVAAGACLEAGRRAGALSVEVRREWDQVASEIVKRLALGDGRTAGPSRGSWASRKGAR